MMLGRRGIVDGDTKGAHKLVGWLFRALNYKAVEVQ